MSAEKNPLYKGTTDGDYVNLDLKDAVKADVKVQVFDDATGYPGTESKSITIDFANPPDEPVMIDSVMKDPAKREMYEISLDIKNKKWEFQLVRMEKQDDGSFKRVELDQKGSEPFDPAKLTGKRETSLDNPETYMPFVRDSQRGVNATAEAADGSGVWNGRMKSLLQSLDKREGNWERVNISVDARYGLTTDNIWRNSTIRVSRTVRSIEDACGFLLALKSCFLSRERRSRELKGS